MGPLLAASGLVAFLKSNHLLETLRGVKVRALWVLLLTIAPVHIVDDLAFVGYASLGSHLLVLGQRRLLFLQLPLFQHLLLD